MIKPSKSSILLVAALAVATSGCGIMKKKQVKTPSFGERIAILTSEGEIEVDPAVAAQPMVLPEAVANTEWAQAGGNATKSMGQLALGTSLGEAWRTTVGRGSTIASRLTSPPVVADGRVYTVDTAGTVRASDASTGAALWSLQTPSDKGNGAAMYGGGVAFEGGKVFATNGLGHVVAIDAATGASQWQIRPGGPLRGAPSVANGTLYVMSQDNQLYSIATADGKINWSAAAALQIAGVLGSASPAVGAGTVVAGFSSGELNAYRYENGRQVWQDTLERTSINTAVSTLSDVDASPVIDTGQVYAVGQGGRLVALELTTGQRLWEANIAGISTPWVAGDWLFVLTDNARIICFSRLNGHVRWINQLQAFRKVKTKKGQIDYYGPVLAGGRLIVVGNNGGLLNFDPENGSFQSQISIGTAISVPPAVANNTLYVLDDKAQLHAFR
ncbi:MAG: PQQ-binding-like beta-propeller repeat protein [Sphingomicrobium sp.]